MAFLGRTTTRPATEDLDGDGRIDGTDDAIKADATTTSVGRAQVDERVAARRRLQDRTDASTDPTTTEPVTPVVTGPRPRASLVATLSLVAGVVAAITVLTGVLAGPGVALGLIAVLLGIGGMAATGRRHVAGKSDAMLGLALGLGAVVVGVMTLTGAWTWLSPDTNQVMRVHDWLAARVPWLFPSS